MTTKKYSGKAGVSTAETTGDVLPFLALVLVLAYFAKGR